MNERKTLPQIITPPAPTPSIPLPAPIPAAPPPEQAIEEESLTELLDHDSPLPPIMDKELEAAARKIKRIEVDPNDLDGTAKRIRGYVVRALNCERGAVKSAVLAGVYGWYLGDAFQVVHEILWPRREWTAWYRKHGWQKDFVGRCLRFRAGFSNTKELCKFDSLGAMDAAAKAAIAGKDLSHGFDKDTSEEQETGEAGDETTATNSAEGKRRRGKKKLDLATVACPVAHVEQLAQQQYKGTELLDQIVDSLNLAVERGGFSDKKLLELAPRVLYCCDRKGVERNDWERDQSILHRDLDKLLEVWLQYAHRASPVWLFETVAKLTQQAVQHCGNDLSEKDRQEITVAVEAIHDALRHVKTQPTAQTTDDHTAD